MCAADQLDAADIWSPIQPVIGRGFSAVQTDTSVPGRILRPTTTRGCTASQLETADL